MIAMWNEHDHHHFVEDMKGRDPCTRLTPGETQRRYEIKRLQKEAKRSKKMQYVLLAVGIIVGTIIGTIITLWLGSG